MKIKTAAWVLVAGFVAGFAGTWAKITHQAYADSLVSIATVVKIAGILSLTYFLLQHPLVKAFLKSRK